MTTKSTITFIIMVILCISFNEITYGQGAAINQSGSAADPSAVLDVSSTTGGLLMPRMTTAERNAINSPAQSLMIFNTTTLCFEFYASGMWQTIVCSCPSIPAPNSGIHSVASAQITWNWTSVSGAAGYKWNTTNDYNSAVDVGNNTSYTETSLNCGTNYTRYVWAYTICNNSSSVSLSATTSSCPCGQSVTYNQVTNATTGKIWLDRNLGALQVASSSTDYNAYGSLFQWGRPADEHQCVTWTGSGSGTPFYGTTGTIATTDAPGHNLFIITTPDWRSPKNNNLWQGAAGINNPCPSGFRVPTTTEWSDEIATWSAGNTSGAFNSVLKLTVAGVRNTDGTIQSSWSGQAGYYWTSTVATSGDLSYVHQMYFNGSSYNLPGTYRSYGMSVRCIKD